MNTEPLTRAESLEKAVIVAQLVQDTSTAASGWFLRPAGFDPQTWHVQVLSEPRPPSTAATGLDPTTSDPIEAHWQDLLTYRPRTPLGQRLWNIRARIVASGEPLLTWEDIDRELAERRGERESQTE